jgi:hypothetical protein
LVCGSKDRNILDQVNFVDGLGIWARAPRNLMACVF